MDNRFRTWCWDVDGTSDRQPRLATSFRPRHRGHAVGLRCPGDPPTHPEIIEYLASELIHHGWSLKHVHRLILKSATYQQSAQFSERAAKIDPDNKLWWRYHPPHRLEGEAIRDCMLAVSGRLDTTPFGKGTLDEKSTRRSIYFTVKRRKLVPSLIQWDWPEALTGVSQRTTTIVPTQALWMLNNPGRCKCAQELAKKLEANPDADAINRAYQLCLIRAATPMEMTRALAFLKTSDERARTERLADLVQTLFLLPESSSPFAEVNMFVHGTPDPCRYWNRRDFLRRTGGGAGLLGLATLLSDAKLLQAGAHHPAKAKSVIWLFLNGGPSQVDTFDYKPELAKYDGKPLDKFDVKTAFFVQQQGMLMKSPFQFQQHGRSGSWVSEIFPNLAKVIDHCAFVHSCYAESNNHGPALFQINAGLPGWASHRWAVGFCMDWAPRTATCPAMW